MIIVKQNGEAILNVSYFLFKYDDIFAYYKNVITGDKFYENVGKYATRQRRKEVSNKLIEAFKNKEPVFIMPAE